MRTWSVVKPPRDNDPIRLPHPPKKGRVEPPLTGQSYSRSKKPIVVIQRARVIRFFLSTNSKKSPTYRFFSKTWLKKLVVKKNLPIFFSFSNILVKNRKIGNFFEFFTTPSRNLCVESYVIIWPSWRYGALGEEGLRPPKIWHWKYH